MELEIRPEPGPEEREAILASLERLLRPEPPAAYRSAWRTQAIRENVEDPPEED